MLQIGYVNVKEILKLPGNTKIFDNGLRLVAESTVDLQCFFSVNPGHLEIMF
jgi:hypothetical protein